MPFNDDHTGPFPIAAFNITMLLWVEGQQYSLSDPSDILTEGGWLPRYRDQGDLRLLEHRDCDKAVVSVRT
jgi:hypothetical protein